MTFTPTDTANYNTVGNTVNVTVVPTYTLIYIAGANGSLTGATNQTVVQGGSGTAVTALPGTGYHFLAWSDAVTNNPRTDVNVTTNLSVAASFTIRQYTFAVSSAHGTPNPTGVTTHNWNTVLSPYLASGIIENTHTQYVATGWAGTGSLTNGTGTGTVFNITSDTTMGWQWRTNYWVDLEILGE